MKTRLGYISNSSSSSFMLLTKEDRQRVIAIWNAMNLERFNFGNVLEDYGPEEAVKSRFEEIVSAMETDVETEIRRFLSLSLLHLEEYCCAVGNERNSNYERNNLMDDLESIARMGNVGPIVNGIKRKICSVLYSNKKISKSSFDYKENDELLKNGVNEILKAFPDICACEFSSDSGTKEEIFIRCYGLIPLTERLRDRGIRFLLADNS